MPVTPFHGGIGLLAKGCLGRRFSFIGFCATQVAIDCESGYHLLRDDWPVHRSLHTLLGATVVCTIIAVVFRRLGTRFQRDVSARSGLTGLARADLASAAAVPVTITTIVLGVGGHLIPDGIMHSDVRPFAPFSEANPLYDFASLAALHASMVAAGILGTLLVAHNARAPAKR